MSDITEFFKINPNQNILFLFISLVSLGVSEYFNLGILFCFSRILVFLGLISVAVTLCAYTVNYWRNKMK